MKIFFLLMAGACVACGSSDSGSSSMDLVPDGSLSDVASTLDSATSDGSAAAEGGVEDFAASASDFDCSHNSEWTTVGLAHYKNVLGHTTEMLAVARSAAGGTYPVGTIVQLNPAEAMVKRGNGFDATSNDWEFFTLTDSDAGSTINNRGGGMSVSNPKATCLSCHLPAQAQFDLICGDPVEGGPTTTHGCTPLPVPTSTLASLPDSRCP